MDEETRSQVKLWAGAGVLVAGAGVMGYALVGADGVYPTGAGGEPYTTVVPQYRPGVTLDFAVGCGVLALVAVALVAWIPVVAWLGARGRLTAYPRPRFLASVGVVSFAIGTVGYLVRWVQVSAVPFPGDRALLAMSACGFGLVGTGLVHVAATRLWSTAAVPRRCSRREYAAFVGGVMGVVVAAGTVVAVAGEPSRVDATTAAAVQAPAVPADPTGVLWRWSGAEEIGEAVAAGAGVVVATGDGVVALDGRTGEERWHHRQAGTLYYPDLAAVDEGRGVVVSFDGRLHAFDAFTGELRWRDDEATAQTPPRWDAWITATDSTVVRQRYGPIQFAGTDVRTGEMRWQYTLPSQCGIARTSSIGDTVIIQNLCTRFEEVTALDGATGELLWRRSRAGNSQVGADMVLLPLDDVRLDPRSGQESKVEADGRMAASDSGELISTGGALYEVGAAEPRWQLPRRSSSVTDDSWYTCAATFLGAAAVLLDVRDQREFRLTIVDRADGTVRRSFADADLPAQNDWTGTEVFPAPGAVVVSGSNELVAFG